jgi:septum formation protein
MENERGPQASGRAAGARGASVMEPLVLASGSPRRSEILRAVGWPFEAAVPDVDETPGEGEAAEDYVRRLAREKAGRVASARLFGLVLGADTVVVVDGDILGKPRDAGDAARMLRRLAARTHEVLTGVALVRAETGRTVSGVAGGGGGVVGVAGGGMGRYVETGEPLDKAGAYAVQGRAAPFIESIEGEYWNVVGLPIRLLYELARDFREDGVRDGG